MAKKSNESEMVQAEAVKAENKFSKEQLLMSKHFQDRKDIVNALLSDEKLYTVKSVEEKIANYMKGKVK